MKKRILSLLVLFVFTALLLPSLAEDVSPLDQLIQQFREDDSPEARIPLLRLMAEEYAGEPDNQNIWMISGIWLGDRMKDRIPENWAEYPHTECEAIPEEAMGHPCLILRESKTLAAWMMIHLPPEMIATSLEEAEYVIEFESHSVDSGYEYSKPVKSYHLDYYGYLYNLNTGECWQFWYQRQYAARGGYSNELNGKPLSESEIWDAIRSAMTE